MNSSQIADPRFWRRWYASGAVAQPKLPRDGLAVYATDTIKGDRQIVWIGKKVVRSGPGFSISEPIMGFVVPPPNDGRHHLGTRITRIPGNAVPVNVHFAAL